MGYGLTATRLTDPAMAPDDLPALHFIVLSHYHGDHFDFEEIPQRIKGLISPSCTWAAPG
ncbi:MAG: hypothetical protein WKF56_05010 [Candidatus Limnocylindrales bacterium]